MKKIVDYMINLALAGALSATLVAGGMLAHQERAKRSSEGIESIVSEQSEGIPLTSWLESPSETYTMQPEPVISERTTPPQKSATKSYAPYGKALNPREVDLLAKMVWGEARGQTHEERIAVAYTSLNRTRDGKQWNGETITEVLQKPWQYSCFNKNDPNYSKIHNPSLALDPTFTECVRAAEMVLSEAVPDPTGGATHYFNPKVVTPPWASKLEKIGKLKTSKGVTQHVFYREH